MLAERAVCEARNVDGKATVIVDLPSFRSTVRYWAMLWRSLFPVRHPAGFIEPCLPTLGHTVPSGPQWAHEIEHDGYRFICRMEGNRIRVFSRRGSDYTERVPGIVDTLARLPASR